MGGANGKTTDISSPMMAPPAYDAHDPRSPSLKRTPISTPEDWRHKAVRARIAAQDPRSPSVPGVERTPLAEANHTISDPVTPLTLSYDNCGKLDPNDPRSPMQFRTPLNSALGIPKFDTSAVECAPFVDDTVIINNAQPVETNELDQTISVSSGAIDSPLAVMTIVSNSTEVAPLQLSKEVEEVEEDAGRKALVQSEQDIEVPSSPLGASACRLEDSDAKVAVSSPILPADRKRKMTKQLIGVSPLKKSYSSPTQNENDENASPILAPARRTTPTTPRRSPSGTRHKRTPSGARSSNLKNSEGAKSPRSPLSPLVPRAQRNVDAPPAFLL